MSIKLGYGNGNGDGNIVPLTIGEVHTSLLLTSTAVSDDIAVELLAIAPGRSVRTRQRPIRYARSPEVLTGVDCSAPLAERREVRIVGTPATQLSLTDGRIIQAGTRATFRHDPAGRRRPWAHYLAQPGVLEVLGKASEESLAVGSLQGPATTVALDLGAVNMRILAAIQRSEGLDRNPPFRSRRTRLRWSAEPSDGKQEIVFTLGADGLRTVRLRAAEPDPRALADFCADLALHDWLLSTLLDIVDHSLARSRPATELISMLRPAIDHLVHAWMPAAHVSKRLDPIWQELDLRAGFSLQWQKTVERIRDQLSVGVIEALRPSIAQPRSESG
ncbi:MAG: SCO2521 family protein [Trebonia sp.]